MPVLEQIGSLTERIRNYNRKLEAICQEHYPETLLLRIEARMARTNTYERCRLRSATLG